MAGSCSNLLEGALDLERAVHLTIHFSLHERTPQALRQEILTHVTFIGVAIFSRSFFSDLLLVLDSDGSSVDSVGLVSDTLL